MKFTYLLIDFFAVLVPFIFSFHRKLKFYKHWPALFPAIALTGILFLGWDSYFTHLKVWGFNADYLTGAYIGNLPIEEVMFFLCIPYACVFTYASLNVIMQNTISARVQLAVSIFLISVSAVMVVSFHDRYYTCSAFAVLAILVITTQFVIKPAWLARFYITYLLLLLPFLIVNGLLTGTGLHSPIVWYNPLQMINLRIFTIPVEDIFYGMDLILLNIIIYTAIGAMMFRKMKNRRKQHNYDPVGSL